MEKYSAFSMLFKPETMRFAMKGPKRITPITAENNPELYAFVDNLCQRGGVPTPNIIVYDTDPPEVNAKAMYTKPTTMAFSRPALQIMSREELEAIALHEVGHLKAWDEKNRVPPLAVAGGAVGGVAGFGIAKRLGGLLKSAEHTVEKTPLQRITGVATTAAVALTGTHIGLKLGKAKAIRLRESAADRFTVEHMDGNAVPIISALEKTMEFNRASKTGSRKLWVRLNSEHPNFEQRREDLGVTNQDINEYRRAEHGHAPAKPLQPVIVAEHESPAQDSAVPAPNSAIPAQVANRRTVTPEAAAAMEPEQAKETFAELVRLAQAQSPDWKARTAKAEADPVSATR